VWGEFVDHLLEELALEFDESFGESTAKGGVLDGCGEESLLKVTLCNFIALCV
jgi:hypothetical protein